MNRDQILNSTISMDAAEVAREYGIGLEIAEYCTAMNMDELFPETHAAVQKAIDGIEHRTFHGPFNELFPCAIDPKAKALASSRFRQAIDLAVSYGANKVILHGGYNPWLYYPIWYTEQSIPFWQSLVPAIPDGMTVCVENVLETEPEMLLEIVRAVDSPKIRLCLDIGHVNAYSPHSVFRWLELWRDDISHFHIHNNMGDRDSHSGLAEGTIPMKEFLTEAFSACPDATFALELLESRASAEFICSL